MNFTSLPVTRRHIKSSHVHFVLVCCFPALLTWACAGANAVLPGLRPQRAGFATSLPESHLSNFFAQTRMWPTETPREPELYQRFGTAGPALVQQPAEDRDARPATTTPTSRHRRASARTEARGESRRHSSRNHANVSAQTGPRSHKGHCSPGCGATFRPTPMDQRFDPCVIRRWRSRPGTAGTRKRGRSCCFLHR